MIRSLGVWEHTITKCHNLYNFCMMYVDLVLSFRKSGEGKMEGGSGKQALQWT